MRFGNPYGLGRILPVALILFLLHVGSAPAKPRHLRFGFQNFPARYAGGYTVTVVSSALTVSGPATIRIHASKNGRSAKVDWRNTFYTPQGTFRVSLHWIFSANGALAASTMDPRVATLAANGTFTLNRNLPVNFTATDATGLVTATGQLRLIGGGALSIAATLSGLPEGDVTFGFSGGRAR
ncbi:MAG: hypothetical protein PHC88_14705 [Terrimicrobiaceae bacterium]|nr:hypothetical protein [Terrimicrobiaceae bacterium]